MRIKWGYTMSAAIVLMLTAVLLFASCGNQTESKAENTQITQAETESKTEDIQIMQEETGVIAEYMQITQEEAKSIMDTQTGYVILDVRTDEEYAAGHIPGAILIPDNEIGSRAESELTDKAQLILVYCRSGRRSKLAASELASLGYTNVKEFGGINDWQYEIVQ